MLLPVISIQAFKLEPPLLPVVTLMARWNNGAPVVSGSANVLLVMCAITVPEAPVDELKTSMPRLFTWRMSLLLTAILTVPPVPGNIPRPAQLLEQPEPVVPVLPILLPLNVPCKDEAAVVVAPLYVTA